MRGAGQVNRSYHTGDRVVTEVSRVTQKPEEGQLPQLAGGKSGKAP